MYRSGRAVWIALGVLLSCLVACGRAATGAPLAAEAPLEPAAASTTVEQPGTASGLPSAAGTAEHDAASHDGAPRRASARVAATAAAGPARGSESGPPDVTLVARPGPQADDAAPAADHAAPRTTTPVRSPTPTPAGPTRTPAPLLIDPIDAFATLKIFSDTVAASCERAHSPGCLRIVPRTLPGQSLPVDEGCTVVSAEPDVRPDPADREKKIAIPRDEIPKKLDTVVDCANRLETDPT